MIGRYEHISFKYMIWSKYGIKSVDTILKKGIRTEFFNNFRFSF